MTLLTFYILLVILLILIVISTINTIRTIKKERKFLEENLNVKINVDGGDKRKVPRIKSVLYFISYFWQIQNHESWPIFYNSLRPF